MSYLLQFPPRAHPSDLTSPPYVIFGINSKDISKDLPSKIPLATVLHFAPKLEKWIIPEPPYDVLPREMGYASLREPYVGIDIKEHINPKGLEFILNKMLQEVRPLQGSNFICEPDIAFSCEVLKAWRVLELPEAGCEALTTHLFFRVASGSSVTITECKAVWAAFPHTAPIMQQLVLNYVRGLRTRVYGPKEVAVIEDWICLNKDRKQVFNEVECSYKDPAGHRPGTIFFAESGMSTAHVSAPRDKASSEVLERERTLKVSTNERRDREKHDGIAMKQRIRRLKSDSSVRSVDSEIVYFPPTPAAQEPQAATASEKGKGKEVDESEVKGKGKAVDEPEEKDKGKEMDEIRGKGKGKAVDESDKPKGSSLLSWKKSVSDLLALTTAQEPRDLSRPVSSLDLLKALEKLQISSSNDKAEEEDHDDETEGDK